MGKAAIIKLRAVRQPVAPGPYSSWSFQAPSYFAVPLHS